MSSKEFLVLVVEDEKLIARHIAKHIPLCNPAFKVMGIAQDGRQALDEIERQTPDLVVTDVCMPELDGIELTRILNADYPQIKKIIVSGHDDFSYAQSAIENNISNYLLKPVNMDELREALDKLESEYMIEKGEIFRAMDMKRDDPELIARAVKEYMLQHYREQTDLTTIAADIGISLSYLTKLFAKYFGVSPSRFLRQHRMSVARQLLSDPSYSVREVAELVGMPDQFHFSKAFKQAWGFTPSHFKRGLSAGE